MLAVDLEATREVRAKRLQPYSRHLANGTFQQLSVTELPVTPPTRERLPRRLLAVVPVEAVVLVHEVVRRMGLRT